MPVSHPHKAVFVHVPRTAGSSVSQVLGICGDDNRGTLTPARPDLLYGLVGTKVLQHLNARAVRDRLGREVYDSYYKFTFVRNPFDRIVSVYHVRKKLLPKVRMTFRDFVLKRLPRAGKGGVRALFQSLAEKALEDQFETQFDFLHDETGRLMVDFVGRQENIDADFAKICARLGIEGKLPNLNESSHDGYRSYFDDETRAAIETRYGRDLKAFGYAF